MTATDWRTVPMPGRIARLPRDDRGFPITYVTFIRETGPDFSTLDALKVREVSLNNLCGLCGGPRGAYMAFVGGPKSTEAHHFFDPPMHRDCAEYAVQVCPFIVIPTARYRKTTEADDVNPLVDPDRPTEFYLVIVKKYRTDLINGQVFFKTGDYESITQVKRAESL